MVELRAIDPAPPGKEVSEYLDHVREKVRRGNVSAIAVAFVYRDGSTGSGHSALPNTATMVGSVEALKAKLIRSMIGEN